MTALCALQGSLESLSLSDCPDGRVRRRFAGGLGRGCSAPLGGPSLPPEAEAEEFSVEGFIVIAVRFRFCILGDAGAVGGSNLREDETRRALSYLSSFDNTMEHVTGSIIGRYACFIRHKTAVLLSSFREL